MSEIHKKLLEAQKHMRQPVFNKVNPHFKSDYADLSEVNDCVLQACGDAGLFVAQPICRDEYGAYIETRVTDGDGETVVLGQYPLDTSKATQQFGSDITYGRRYSLCAAFCLVADADDDGNAAQEAGKLVIKSTGVLAEELQQAVNAYQAQVGKYALSTGKDAEKVSEGLKRKHKCDGTAQWYLEMADKLKALNEGEE